MANEKSKKKLHSDCKNICMFVYPYMYIGYIIYTYMYVYMYVC